MPALMSLRSGHRRPHTQTETSIIFTPLYFSTCTAYLFAPNSQLPVSLWWVMSDECPVQYITYMAYYISTIHHTLYSVLSCCHDDFSAGLSLVQFRELLGNWRINELSLWFRVGSLIFCSGTFSSVPFVKKWVAELFVRFRSLRVELLLRVEFGFKVQIHLKYWKKSSLTSR